MTIYGAIIPVFGHFWHLWAQFFEIEGYGEEGKVHCNLVFLEHHIRMIGPVPFPAVEPVEAPYVKTIDYIVDDPYRGVIQML